MFASLCLLARALSNAEVCPSSTQSYSHDAAPRAASRGNLFTCTVQSMEPVYTVLL